MVDNNYMPPSMSQRIFELKLPVETVSAYLLCCGMNDIGETITTRHLLDVWTSSKESLANALKDLEERNILQKIISDREEKSIYKLNDEKMWKAK